jgi:hypothetical protein
MCPGRPIVGEPRAEEVGVPADTDLCFEFGDDIAGHPALGVVVLVVFVLFFVESESEGGEAVLSSA